MCVLGAWQASEDKPQLSAFDAGRTRWNGVEGEQAIGWME